MTFHHLDKFSHLDPAGYFDPDAAAAVREFVLGVDLGGGLAARSADDLLAEALAPLVDDGAMSAAERGAIVGHGEAMIAAFYSGGGGIGGQPIRNPRPISDPIPRPVPTPSPAPTVGDDDPTYASIEVRLEAIRREILDDPALSDYMRASLYDMVSAMEGVVLDAVNDIAAAEARFEGKSVGTVDARGLGIDCVLGMKPACWAEAFVKLAISTAAAFASGGASKAIVGSTIVVKDLVEKLTDKGLNSFFTAILTGYTQTGTGNKCSCKEAIKQDPCEVVQASFVVDPLSIDCANPGEIRLKVFGAEDAENVDIIYYFDRPNQPQNVYAKYDGTRARTYRTNDPGYITLVQVDPDEPVHISATIEYDHLGARGSDRCEKTALTPNYREEPGWAWNLHHLSDDLGSVLISGATNLPRGDHSAYRATGLFRQIPGVTFEGIRPNFAGRISSDLSSDPYAVQITWDVATSQGGVYATANNLCGTVEPGYLRVNVY